MASYWLFHRFSMFFSLESAQRLWEFWMEMASWTGPRVCRVSRWITRSYYFEHCWTKVWRRQAGVAACDSTQGRNFPPYLLPGVVFNSTTNCWVAIDPKTEGNWSLGEEVSSSLLPAGHQMERRDQAQISRCISSGEPEGRQKWRRLLQYSTTRKR